MSTISERTFIVHPDGTGEIYNLQVVDESELPEFFEQFTVTTESEPSEYRDSDWTEAARRWRFYEATNLTTQRIDKIVEAHNKNCERILEPAEFQCFDAIEVDHLE